MHWGWAYDGVNASVPRNTGPECANYLSTQRHWLEGVCVVTGCLLVLRWAWQRAGPLPTIKYVERPMPFVKKLLLLCMTFTLGLELGFKLSSRSVIYILNPCHITTVMQIYLLIAKPSKFTTGLFRLQLNYLNGPLLAYLFPEIESRRVALERHTYYIQHGLMFVIPVYLLQEGGVYNMEPLTDFNWNVMGMSLNLLYHFVVLEFFAIPSQVNLNHMLCPAILDPFEGANFRLFAVVHQSMLCPLLCKLVCYFCRSTAAAAASATVVASDSSISMITATAATVDDNETGTMSSTASAAATTATTTTHRRFHNENHTYCDKNPSTTNAATTNTEKHEAIAAGGRNDRGAGVTGKKVE